MVPKDKVDLYVLLHGLSSLKRSGWVDYNVEDPETVMCHMYDAWLIGKLFLPEDFTSSEYDKAKILDMLLIHDLAESVTGDIVTPLKEKDKWYDVKENTIMKEILSMLPDGATLTPLWEKWSELKTYNSQIAKDIDILQSVIQYALYRPYNQNLQDDAVTSNWLGKRDKIRTDVALGIFDKMIEHITSTQLQKREIV